MLVVSMEEMVLSWDTLVAKSTQEQDELSSSEDESLLLNSGAMVADGVE